MAKLRNIRPQSISIERINEFLGADFSESSNISFSRSPGVINMIRETPGKVRKWLGYRIETRYEDRINGAHVFSDGTRIVHSGTRLFIGNKEIQGALNDELSTSAQLNGKMLIFDGKRTIVVEKTGNETYSCKYLDTIGTVPIILIASAPTGGGTLLQPVNLLQPKRTVYFLSTTTDKVYQLPFKDLDSTTVEVKVRNTSGGFDTYTEGTEFTVDRALGQVTFKAVPPAPVVIGQDNVFITAAKTNPDYAGKINKAVVCTVYGSNGGRDRIFCAGDNNTDYYSEFNDPLYFADIAYTALGSDNSRIMGYTVINDKLATHLDKSSDDTNVILRESITIEEKTKFRLIGSYQGTGAISKYAFSTLANEPIYPTVDGIVAVTPADYTSERSAQDRSYYINRLLKQQNLANSYGCVFNNFYMLAVGNYIFALDSLQVSRTRDEPYSRRQYEGYVRDGVKARIIWEENEKLYFGGENGIIDVFFTDIKKLSSFNDEGRKISAKWTTPPFMGRDFQNKKQMKRIAVLLGAAVATSCRIWAIYDGERELVYDYDGEARYFTFSQFTFSKLTFKTDKTAQKIIEKLSGIKPKNGIIFEFENDIINEPFSLEECAIEYTEKR